MSNLKQLEQELFIARKFNLGAREINKLENLIEIEKAKIQNKKGEHKKMGFRKLLAWIISIILMASYSYLQADIIKVKVVKPKKSKTEQRKESDKKKSKQTKSTNAKRSGKMKGNYQVLIGDE